MDEAPEAAEHEEGEEEEPAEDDEEVPEDGDQKRDYGKARKFQRMLKQGLVPQEIKDLYESPNANRLVKTRLINKLFKKTKDGQYLFQPGEAKIEHLKSSEEQRFGKAQVCGYPKSIMLHHWYNGNSQALNEAILNGEVEETEEDGVPYCTFKQVKAGKKKAFSEQTKIDLGSAKVDSAEAAEIGNFLKKRPWSQYGHQVEKCLGSSSDKPPAKRMLALEDDKAKDVPIKILKAAKVSWSVVESVLQDAKGSQERLLRDAQRIVAKVKDCNDGELALQLKEVMNQLTETQKTIQEALVWQSIEGTDMERTKVEAWLDNVATSTEKSNEQLERLKATLKARGLLK